MKSIYSLFFLLLFFMHVSAQSFNDEKTAAINFVKRAYNASPFEGVKKLEGEEGNYYVVAVSYEKRSKDSVLAHVAHAKIKAQNIAEQDFAEPFIKFEMIGTIENSKYNTYLFLCETLEKFITSVIKKKNIDGARIIAAPGNKYIISTMTLDNSKHATPEMRDRVAQLKSKQMVNTLVNGSTITSDIIIKTDENAEQPDIEVIKEHAMGFIQGMELLFGKEFTANKTTYVYYSKI